MLSEIAADVLRFLTRRDLDSAGGVSKWLDAMIDQCCDVFPLRPVAVVKLHPYGCDFMLEIRVENDGDSLKYRRHSFTSMDDTARFVGSILHHSYVERFWVGDFNFGKMTLRPDQWTMLIEAIRRRNIRELLFERVDFSALDADAFLVAVACRDLRSFERVRASPERPRGTLKFYGTPKQRGLAAYADYLAPSEMYTMDATYRFPPLDNDTEFYDVGLRERSSYVFMKFCFV